MKIENGKIVECTKSELIKLYLERDMGDTMDFNEYWNRMEECGCKIVKEG